MADNIPTKAGTSDEDIKSSSEKNEIIMSELYKENVRMKKENDSLRRVIERDGKHPSIYRKYKTGRKENVSDLENDDPENYDPPKRYPDNGSRPEKRTSLRHKCVRITRNLIFILLLLIVVGMVVYIVINQERTSDLTQPIKDGVMSSLESSVGRVIQTAAANSHINLGIRQDYRLQDCTDKQFKLSFPDVDYSLLGYNILRGYPLALGHDPGFTFPIFQADYTDGSQTADCRYRVPKGLFIVPDVSCVMSFSSKTVQTQYEFSEELSISANVHGGGWGASFSASFGYKQSSSEISTGESVFIFSKAKCNYYFSKLIKHDAPAFDKVFLKWVHKLDATNDSDTYFEFIDTFGTHYPTEVTFGARFTYQHKMSSQKFEKSTETGVNVAVQASYSGLFSAGGGFGLDSNQKQSASDFQQNVETKTITVGAAPPANGDAMTWASQVETSPVPTSYQLTSIENLFTDTFMEHLGVNHKAIKANIERYSGEYCSRLKELGELDNCDKLHPGILLENTRLTEHYKELAVDTISECIEKCLSEISCKAITFCSGCTSKDVNFQACYMFKEITTDHFLIGWVRFGTEWVQYGTEDSNWKTSIFIEKIKNSLKFASTTIIGDERDLHTGSKTEESPSVCFEMCFKDAHCIAYTYCDCPERTHKCSFYSQKQIKSLKKAEGYITTFISNRSPVTTSTSAPSITSTSAPSTGSTSRSNERVTK